MQPKMPMLEKDKKTMYPGAMHLWVDGSFACNSKSDDWFVDATVDFRKVNCGNCERTKAYKKLRTNHEQMIATFDRNLPTAYNRNVSLLSKDGEPFCGILGCKDYVHDAVQHRIYPSFAYGTNHGIRDVHPDFDEPKFVCYVRTDSESTDVERCAEKFEELINQVEERMGLEGRSMVVAVRKKHPNSPIVGIAPPFWLKSPVAASAYLTLMRLSPTMRYDEMLEEFIERIQKGYKSRTNAQYLRRAIEEGNWKRLLDRSLRCLNREGLSDYLLSTHARGIAYYREYDDTYPKKEKALKKAIRRQNRRRW